MVKGLASAKINLALHVTGRRADGYHLLDSLVVFAEQADELTITTAETLSLVVGGPFAKGVPTNGTNLVMQAAKLLQQLRDVSEGASISLEKNLPHGGGIGGGSSDAATALRLLAKLWQVTPLNAAEALPLGADLPVCMQAPTPCFMQGVGEIIKTAPPLPEFWLVLVNPGVNVATGAVFQQFDQRSDFSSAGLEALPNPNGIEQMETWLNGQGNDLTKVASQDAIAPVISDVLSELREYSENNCAEMSGSGSTCWGFFRTDSAAHHAEVLIAKRNPEWWVQMTKIGG